MVRPGELAVVQTGIRFKVTLPDGTARGYVQELFGSRYELPELGPFGSNGLALPRDFEFPIASFDMDNSEWENKDQADPSLYTVLTAKSKIPGVSVTDFMFFCPKYSSATNTFRPPVSFPRPLLGPSD
ncbi:hypothetical protein COL154_002102 [Colletotrichum chrysophilum]|nr:hypothetical protein COL154_002102 [Colletotrichum chrysophilum]